MTDVGASAIQDLPINSSVASSVDFNARVSTLRHAGAAQFDPVRLHYLQVLAQRAAIQPAPVKRLLNAKLTQALADFQKRFEQVRSETQNTIAYTVLKHPDLAAELQRLLDEGDFKAVRQRIQEYGQPVHRPSLSDLTRHLAQRSFNDANAGLPSAAGRGTELESTQFFRDTWSKLSVGKRVTQAMAQAPKNAGPINSHSLVLKSLATLHALSPDYLSRFTSYVDTLLSLDQRDNGRQLVLPKPTDGDIVKKTKSRRAKAP